MLKITTFTLLFSACLLLNAQFLQPVFEEPILLNDLNSEAEESIPILTKEGSNVLFHRTYFEESGDGYDVLGRDIWFAELKKDASTSTEDYSKSWKRPYRLFREGEVEGINDIVGASSDGSRLYLLNTTFSKDTYSRQLVTLERKGEDEWENSYREIKIPGLVFDGRRIELRMNENEDVLLVSMASSRRAQYEDLYLSLKQKNGRWSKLINLGKNINTSSTEMAPFLAKDNKTLYFTSDGHDGYGDGDIFMSKRLDDSWKKWTRPMNLGESINSSGFDGYFVMANEDEVYFVSDRESEFYDLYATIFTGEYKSASTEQISGEFRFQNLPLSETKLEIYDTDGNLIDIVETDEEGKFTYTKLKSDEDYFVQLQSEEPNDWQGAKVYLVNEKGVAKRYILTDNDNKQFEHDKNIKNKKVVYGFFALNDEAQKGKALIIKDENNFILDTIYTDEKGGFKYEQLSYDEQVSISPLDISEEELAKVDVYLLDENGNKTQKLTLSAEGFISDGKAMSAEGIDESRLVFFEFNSVQLTDAGKEKIKTILDQAKENGIKSFHLIGHADEVGSKKVNYEVGLKRASTVESYISQFGISKDKISVESKGKTAPIAPNDGEKRAKNRRVEIILNNE